MLSGPRELESFAHLLLRFLFSLIVFHEKTSCSAGVHFVAAQSAKPSYVVFAIADFYFLSIFFKKQKRSNVEILYKNKKIKSTQKNQLELFAYPPPKKQTLI